jgi:hypothetical protein
MTPEDVVGAITGIETIAEGSGIRELARIRKIYGPGRWKKKRGSRMYGSPTAA